MYVFTALTARITCAVKPFMMMASQLSRFLRSLNAPENCRSDLRMIFNRLPLNTLERAFLFQYSRRYSDLANIVQQTAKMSSLLGVFRQPELFCDIAP